MNETHKSTWQRLTAVSAHTIVRLWPQETKGWGRAFAAELPEIEGFRSSIRWLMQSLALSHDLAFLARCLLDLPNAAAPADGLKPLQPFLCVSFALPASPRYS